jgi:hypothetical protein
MVNYSPHSKKKKKKTLGEFRFQSFVTFAYRGKPYTFLCIWYSTYIYEKIHSVSCKYDIVSMSVILVAVRSVLGYQRVDMVLPYINCNSYGLTTSLWAIHTIMMVSM